MIREVLRYPDPALKRAARALDPVSDRTEITRVAEDLLDTMGSNPGCVGLAAPQLGELVRMVAIDVTGHRKALTSHGLLVLVNPRVVKATGTAVAREGCLSIPDLTANVRRAVSVEVEALDPRGEPVAVASDGFEARCVQHELDHLDGVLFLDRVDSLVDDVFRRRAQKPAPEPGRSS